MTDTTFEFVDRAGAVLVFRALVGLAGSKTPYHAEDPDQRATLLAALDLVRADLLTPLQGVLKAIGQPGWVVTASATHAQATATKALSAGLSHRIRGLKASFDNPPNGPRPQLQIIVSGSPVYSAFVTDGEHEADFGGSGILIAAGTAVSAVLADGGVGITGAVNLYGDTE